MNILLWVLQGLFGFHTLAGALWKFSNSEQTVPSLALLPNAVWLGLSVPEILAALLLVVPLFVHSLRKWIPYAALFVSFEMVLFSVIHFLSGEADHAPVMYWLVVAAIGAFIAYGRLKLRPA